MRAPKYLKDIGLILMLWVLARSTTIFDSVSAREICPAVSRDLIYVRKKPSYTLLMDVCGIINLDICTKFGVGLCHAAIVGP